MPAFRRSLAGLVSGLAATTAVAVLLLPGPVPSGSPDAPPGPTARDLAIPFVRTETGNGPAYVAATFAGTVSVSPDGAVEYALPGGVLLRERAAARVRAVHAGAPATARVSVFRGPDPARWRRGLPTCASVRVEGVAAGVDLVVAAGARNVEKRYHAAPGADLDALRMRVDGATGLAVLRDGRLDVATERGSLTFTAPVAFQETPRGRTDVPVRYVVDGDAYGFAVAEHDPALPLVIDPLIAATYLGGATAGASFLNDDAAAIAHFGGSVYVVGSTQSDIFPNGFGGDPGYQAGFGGGWDDAFVCRLSDDLSQVEAVTLLGGSGSDEARDVAVTSDGVWVVGRTNSSGFPTTLGAYQTGIGGASTDDAFVAHLTHDLETLLGSTFLGGEAGDYAAAVAIDPLLGVVVAGGTRSQSTTRFSPETALPYQRTNQGVYDAFVTRFDPDLQGINAGTLYGGSFGEDLKAVALRGSEIVICGSTSSGDLPLTNGAFDTTFVREQDGFVARFDAALETLLAATYLGGEAGEYPNDECTDVAVLDSDVAVCGWTASTDFPTTAGAFDETPNADGESMPDDAFVARLSADMTTLVAGTIVGGASSDDAAALAVHDTGLVIVGRTSSDDLPVPPTSEDAAMDGTSDAYVLVLRRDLSDVTSGRYLGGALWERALGVAVAGDVAFVAGTTVSSDFPVTEGAFDTTFNDEVSRDDAFVAAFGIGDGAPPPTDIDSYILPKRLDVKHDAKKPERSWLNAGGWFDTGSGPVDWSRPATLTIGAAEYEIPGLAAAKGGWWEYAEGALFFRIKPSRYGSSKGKFKLKLKGPDVAGVPTDAPLVVRFVNGDVDAVGEVALKDGRYQLGRQRGALLQPRLALYSCKTTLHGAGKDALRARLGIATDAGVPNECPPLTIALDERWTDTVASDAFQIRGRKFVFKGTKGGLSQATVDFGKEKLAIHGTGLDVGTFPEGPQAVSVLVQLGDEGLVLRVRMVRKGPSMRY